MKHIIFAFFLVILMMMGSCSIFGSSPDSSNIVGQWEWFRATDPWVGEVTRDSALASNYQHHLEFDSDFTFSRFKADTLQATGEYSLNEKDREAVLKINYKNGKEDRIVNYGVKFQGNDTLILIAKCYDCGTDYYIRKE